MRRCPSELLLLLLSGCAFGDGQPWGMAELSLEAVFAPGEERLDDQGRLVTSADFAIDIERVAVRFDAVTVRMGERTTDLSFDPASPPPGYTLCHGGHCHHEDGRLVDYTDVERELFGAGAGGFTLVQAVDSGAVELTSEPTDIPLGPCSTDACALQRGTLAVIEVRLGELRVAGTAYDRTDRNRVPEEGLPFDLPFPLSSVVAETLEGTIDNGEPVGFSARASFELTPKLFDDVDFATEELQPIVEENITRESTLSVETKRFDREGDE